MANQKSLSTVVQHERKRISMVPGRLSLVPKQSTVVPIAGGGFAEMPVEHIDIETENINHHYRGGTYTRLYDPSNPKDKAVLDAVERYLEENPDKATDVRYQIRIVGEFQPIQPWSGYDEQTADQVEALWNAMPDSARPKLEEIMKYEQEREGGGDPDKIKVLNKLYRQEDKELKEQAEMGAQL